MRTLLILLQLAFAFAAHATILSNDWRITWDPGVRGGIPSRTTIFATHDADTNTQAIQNSLNACPSNEVVFIRAGTHTLTNYLTIPAGVTLRGAGLSNTVLRGQAGNAAVSNRLVLLGPNYDYDWNATTAIDLTNCAKDSLSVTSMTAHGFSVGDYLIIDTLTNNFGVPPVENKGSIGTATWVGRPDAVGNRPMGQFVLVTNVVSSTVFQVDPPLYWRYSNSPQAFRITGYVSHAGLEDLTVDNQATGTARDIVVMQGAFNSWLSGVELRGSRRRALWLYGAFWNTFKRCLVNGSTPQQADGGTAYTSDRAYGPFFGPHVTACLMESVITFELTMSMALEGNASGNVFTDIISTNIYWNTLSEYPRRFSWLMHGPHPAFNLIEFCQFAERVRADEYWGTSSHHVFHRNVIRQYDRGTPFAQAWTVDIERRNWFYAFIGNIIGGGGVAETHYEAINNEVVKYGSYDGAVPTLWKLMYPVLGAGAAANYDTDGLATILRWKNWCYRTNDDVAGSGITYHTANVVDTGDTSPPSSFWRTEKPADWGALEWPPFDPDAPNNIGRDRTPAGYFMVNGVWPPVRLPGQSATGPGRPVGNHNRNVAPLLGR